MFYVLMFLIAGVWAAFLLPPAIANRKRSPIARTEEFSRLAHGLGKARHVGTDTPEVAATMAAVAIGVDKDGVLARRRKILVGLGGAVLASLMAAWATGNVQVLIVHLVADAALIWYVVMLLQIKARQMATAGVVELVSLPAPATPQLRVISNS
jgi:hypothetical protein